LLHPSDLGSGWYQATTPAITTQTSILPSGALNGARSWLSATHRTNGNWVLDVNVVERTYLFPSHAGARDYLKSWPHSSAVVTSSGSVVSATPRATSTHYTGFVLGNRVYTVEYFAARSLPARTASQSTVLHAAKRRATTGP
jgi:hypothetical protein